MTTRLASAESVVAHVLDGARQAIDIPAAEQGNLDLSASHFCSRVASLSDFLRDVAGSPSMTPEGMRAAVSSAMGPRVDQATKLEIVDALGRCARTSRGTALQIAAEGLIDAVTRLPSWTSSEVLEALLVLLREQETDLIIRLRDATGVEIGSEPFAVDSYVTFREGGRQVRRIFLGPEAFAQYTATLLRTSFHLSSPRAGASPPGL